ncbi:DUF481 domain-containing protein [Saccharicrinis sp. FJH54]|uniref:DUF481 domain-containing protein n=1 Tax=Saccharicrinis sp. FJH54 TaxID=3344665 RepID=UPI0035D50548
MANRLFVFLILILSFSDAYAQNDTLALKNGSVLSGSFKSATNKSISFSPDLIKETVSIKYENISELHTHKTYKFFDSDGNLWFGSVHIISGNPENIELHTSDTVLTFPVQSLYKIVNYSNRFRDNFSFSADLGYNQAKQQNTALLNIGSRLGYKAKRWDFSAEYNTYSSRVDTIYTGKSQADLNVKYILPKNWILNANSAFLSSGEQKIDFRFTNTLGVGNYIYQKGNNHVLLTLGGSGNFERYTTADTLFKSIELNTSVEIQLSLFKDLSLYCDIRFIPSLNETRRIRYYAGTELRYTINKHLKLYLNYDFNYDTNPPVVANKSDYNLSLGVGWTL